MKKLVFITIIFILNVSIATAKDNFAMITDLNGTLIQINNDQPVALNILDVITNNTILELDENSSVKFVGLSNSVEYKLTGPSKFSVENNAIKFLSGNGMNANTMSANKVSAASLANNNVTYAGFKLRSIGHIKAKKLHLITPNATKIIENKPVFTWKFSENTDGYQFSLYNDNFQQIDSQYLQGNSYTYKGKKALEPGQEYTWRIETRASDQKHAQQASFLTATDYEKQKIEKILLSKESFIQDKGMKKIILNSMGFNQLAKELD